MKKARKPTSAIPDHKDRLDNAILWMCVAVVVLVPLAFAVPVYRAYVTPKLAILLVGSSAIATLAGLAALHAMRYGADLTRLFNPGLLVVVTLYVASVAISTFFGIDPVASLFGYFHNQMGLVPKLCFFAIYIGVIIAVGNDESRMRKLLWAMALTGLVTSVYAVIQFFGYDPYVKPGLYTYGPQAGRVRRVIGMLGHADYLGNFLLYTTPLAAALGLSARGRSRLIAWIAAGVSLMAILLSGTRGAWLGIIVAAAFAALLEISRGRGIKASAPRAVWIRRAALALVMIAVAAGVIAISPAARSVTLRARSLTAEGLTGAGRLPLWRDTLKMLPASALVGTGPDSFRLAFLAYESRQVARLTGGDNDSPHNAYLDAAVSYGLPGALLYIAAIGLALRLLLRARRQAATSDLRIIFTGLLAALVAVAVHNFFIYDQLPTGLYFFAFLALAQVAINLVESGNDRQAAEVRATAKPDSTSRAPAWVRPATWAVGIAGGALVVTAIWYATGVLRADLAIKRALAAADRGDLNQVAEQAEVAARSPEPTGDHHLMIAGAFGICSSNLEATANAARQSGSATPSGAPASQRAQELGLAQAQQSLKHSFAPDVGYLFQAGLAEAAGNTALARDSASEAVNLHPNNFRAHLLLARAYTNEGRLEQAAGEAQTALDLRPFSLEAATALARARGEDVSSDAAALKIMTERRNQPHQQKHSTEALIEIARGYSQAGKLQKARVKLTVALSRAAGPCPDCHRELATVYEKMGRYREAINEWQTFIAEAPAGAPVEEVKTRIKTLEARGSQKP